MNSSQKLYAWRKQTQRLARQTQCLASFAAFGALVISWCCLAQESLASKPLGKAFSQKATELAQAFSAPTLSPNEAKALGDSVVILDAREPEEFEQSHLPGAIHVGYKTFDLKKTLAILQKRFDDQRSASSGETAQPQKQKVLVYCSMGYRSGDIAERLRQADNIAAFNLWGGIFAWHKQGFLLKDSSQQATSQVHPYNKNWAKWLEDDGAL